MTRQWRWRWRLRISRDTILFIVGLAGIVFETVTGGPEKPTLIIAFVGMMGLPLFLNNDEQRIGPRRREDEDKDEDDDDPRRRRTDRSNRP